MLKQAKILPSNQFKFDFGKRKTDLYTKNGFIDPSSCCHIFTMLYYFQYINILS